MILFGAALIIVAADGWLSRSLPDLRPWHDGTLLEEFSWRQATSFKDYLDLEEALFTKHNRLVEERFAAEEDFPLFRYSTATHPLQARLERDWNRTQWLPAADARGVFLMVHGLSDSPYSVRSLSLSLNRHGYHVLALRLPGHGTIPGALDEVDWRDWTTAVDLAARSILAEYPDLPFYFVGYSTGAPLGLYWVLNRIEAGVQDGGLPKRMFFLSPALGISPFARFANLQRVISHMSFFKKSRWTSVMPEFDPVKYQSFTKNGARQLSTLLAEVNNQLSGLRSGPGLERLPPVTSFQSVVDETVSTYDLVDLLYGTIDDPASELVLFDVNKHESLARFMAYSPQRLIDTLKKQAANRWTLSLISNRDGDTREVVEKQFTASSNSPVIHDLPYAWPEGIFSLSHVALPFPHDDPVYGYAYRVDGITQKTLGDIQIKGERNVLVIPASELIRVRANPFYDYIERKIVSQVNGTE